MKEKLQAAYRTIKGDNFPSVMRIIFGEGAEGQVLRYEKVGWEVGGKVKGLRYGENPSQEAALYKLVNGNLVMGDVETIQPGRYLVSDAELLQSGKHPGKINLTDADNALNILKFFMDEYVAAIMKHNNPCGVAIGESLVDAYKKANMADRVAAFGGAIALNKSCDKETAEAIVENYSEVVIAPELEDGVMDVFRRKRNLRVMRIRNIERLKKWMGKTFIDFKSLTDGGIITQTSYVPNSISLGDIEALPLGYHEHKGKRYEVKRKPTEQEYKDMWFGWLVESGVTSNSVLYVRDGVTVGIGTGEQDRVGVARIARGKAYEKLMDRICFEEHGIPLDELRLGVGNNDVRAVNRLLAIEEEVEELNGGLKGAVMVSDAFFPFRDGVDVGLREGVTAVIQPGGSKRDLESITACNEAGATMVFTGERSFRH